MRTILNWFIRHFGGRMDYKEVAVESGMFIGELKDSLVVGYKGKLYIFEWPENKRATFISFIMFVLSAPEEIMEPDDLKARASLRNTGPQGLYYLQKKYGRVLKIGYVSEINLNKMHSKAIQCFNKSRGTV